MHKDTVAVLKTARDWIDRGWWVKGEYACTNGFCMMGALGFGNNMAQPDGRANAAKYDAERILFHVIADGGVYTVPQFNDEVAETEADVVEMFDWAIGIAEAGGL